MVHGDTDERALEVQLEVMRRRGPDGRMRLAAAMSEDARRLAIDGERRRHPDLSEDEARQVVFERLWGPDLSAAVRRARGARDAKRP